MADSELLDKTFFYYPDANTIAMATKGAERLCIDGDGHFRIGENGKLDTKTRFTIQGETDKTKFSLNVTDSDKNSLLSIRNDGNVGIGIPDPKAPLHVANYMAVGPFAPTGGEGGIDVTGSVAEFGFVKRSLKSWPANPEAGDRFVWYNPDGTARLWTEKKGDLLTVTKDGDLLGAAKTTANTAVRIVVGNTPETNTNWVQYGSDGIYVDVDTSKAKFTLTPQYFTNLGGNSSHWRAVGTTSIYNPTKNKFRVYINYSGITVARAKEWKWHINWIGIGK